MLRTARFSVELSQFVAGHPDDLERLPDRAQFERVPTPEACRVITALFRQGEGHRLRDVYAECVQQLPACMTPSKLLDWVLVALGRGDVQPQAPFARLVLLRKTRAPQRRKVVEQGKLAPIPRPAPKPPEPTKEIVETWFEVLVVDEVGEPVADVALDFEVGSPSGRKTTNREGKVRIEKADVHRGSVWIADVPAVRETMKPRWSSTRSGSRPTGLRVTDTVVAEPARRVALESEEPHTLVLQPPRPGYAIEAVRFVGNHALMAVNTDDWTSAGSPHPSPEWRVGQAKARPVSYTKGRTLRIDLEIVPKQPGGPTEQADVAGTASFEGQSLRGTGRVGGESATISTEGRVLPDRVTSLAGDIRWGLTSRANDARYDPGSSRGHRVFVTLDTPVSVTGSREQGITERRMEAATRLVGAARSNDPHTVVSHMMRLFRFYTLRPHPGVPAEFKHPAYFNSVGGAWPMADHIDKCGECQAIVRFVKAAIKQVGCPGTADLVVVWADPDVAGGSKALEAVVPPGGGLYDKTKVVGGKTWYACLVDTYPVEGRVYDIEELNASYMGLNNFEACLRFEHGGVRRYYGGGAGTYSSADEVLLAFFALVWVTFGHRAASGNAGARVEKVVKRWRDSQGRIL